MSGTTNMQEKQARMQALERLVPVFIMAALILVVLPFVLW